MNLFSKVSLAALVCAISLGACKSPSTEGGKTSPGQEQAGGEQTAKPVSVEVSKVFRTEKGEGKMAPNFFWKGADGQERSLKDYQGKVVLLNFWATWCPPCRRELPDLVKIHKDLGDKGVEIIGVSVSEEPPAGTSVEDHVAGFARKNNLDYPLVIASEDLPVLYGGINAVPTSFIINAKGEIVKTLVGGRDEATFLKEIQAAM